MQIGPYDFQRSHDLKNIDKFTICNFNSKYDQITQTWSCDLPLFFTDNPAEYRQIQINTFIYFRPDGTSDIATTFHSADLFDCEYSQAELDYFIGMSGTTIAGTYSLNSRKRTLTFWFKDYLNFDVRYGPEETYFDAATQEEKSGPVRFFIQCELIY
ncbi:hypothetical protein [Methanobrevibacter sp.]